MGYRMYSSRIGRFLSVDPLHELMPSHSPYHYAFNSPLVWSDPSGLAPEKDKNIHSEKLQGELIKIRILSSPIMPGEECWVYIEDEKDFYFSAEYDAGFVNAVNYTGLMFRGFGSSRSSGKWGGNGNSGIPLTENMRNNIKYHFSFCYDNDENVPKVLEEKFFDELFGRMGNMISEDNYNFLTSVEHTINLYSPEGWFNFLKTQKDQSSWWDILKDNIREFFGGKPHKPQYGMAYSGNHSLYFQADMFTNDNFDLSKYKIEGPTFLGLGYLNSYNNSLSDIILHELGHSWALFTNGREYNNWNWRYRENWAIFYNNQFRSTNFQGYTYETWYWPYKGKNP